MVPGDRVEIIKCANGYVVRYRDAVDSAEEVYLNEDFLFAALHNYFDYESEK